MTRYVWPLFNPTFGYSPLAYDQNFAQDSCLMRHRPGPTPTQTRMQALQLSDSARVRVHVCAYHRHYLSTLAGDQTAVLCMES